MKPAELCARVAGRPLLLDGGLGSMLIAKGLEPGRAPEHWVREHPKKLAAVHRAYAEAGCELVHAATFGANPLKLAGAGLEGLCREINTQAVDIARMAVPPDVLVAGDLGPTGLLLPPMGPATEEQLEAAYAEQVTVLVQAGVDLLSIETMYDLREALTAVRAARRSGLAVLACMTFESRPRGCFTVMGDELKAALQALAAAGATAAGFNCGVTSAVMTGMVSAAAPVVKAPLVVQPNAGQPRATVRGVVYDADPADFARDLVAMVEAGAKLVGGCCGTTPAFLRAARRALDERVAA